MKILNYLSAVAMPMIILLIILYGVAEKVKVYDVFVEGAKQGAKIVIKLFPTLLGNFSSSRSTKKFWNFRFTDSIFISHY